MPRHVDYKSIKDRVGIAEGSEEYFEAFVPMKGKMMYRIPICSRMKNPRAIVVPTDLAPLQTWYLCCGTWKDAESIRRRVTRKIREKLN